MSPTSRARTDASPRGLGTGDPLPLDSRGARRGVTATAVPRLHAACVPDDHGPLERSIVRASRESRLNVRATPGSEDAGGASPEAPWQGPAGTLGFRWQDPSPDRATRPGGGR
jgi:hypothetical protein